MRQFVKWNQLYFFLYYRNHNNSLILLRRNTVKEIEHMGSFCCSSANSMPVI